MHKLTRRHRRECRKLGIRDPQLISLLDLSDLITLRRWEYAIWRTLTNSYQKRSLAQWKAHISRFITHPTRQMEVLRTIVRCRYSG